MGFRVSTVPYFYLPGYLNKFGFTCNEFHRVKQKDHKQFLFNVARGVVAVAAQGIKVVLPATAVAD